MWQKIKEFFENHLLLYDLLNMVFMVTILGVGGSVKGVPGILCWVVYMLTVAVYFGKTKNRIERIDVSEVLLIDEEIRGRREKEKQWLLKLKEGEGSLDLLLDFYGEVYGPLPDEFSGDETRKAVADDVSVKLN